MIRIKWISGLLLLQAVPALISGFLISRMSWIGRVGIRWFMPQYSIFRSWWKTGLVLFLVQALIVGLLWFLRRKTSFRAFSLTSLVVLLIGIIGLYLTYNDFQTSLSHRLMKEKFHLGFYLFWLGWIGTAVSFLVKRKVVMV